MEKNRERGMSMDRNSLQRLRPSLRMVAQHMEDMGWNCTVRIRDEDLLFRSIQIYDGQRNLKPDVLYLLEGTEEAFPFGDFACVSIRELPDTGNCICCPGKSRDVILNLIMELFAQCREWEYRIDQAVYSNVSLTELCQLGSELLGNPVCIHDDWFLLTAMSWDLPQVMDLEYGLFSTKGAIPRSIVEEFHQDSDYLETFPHRTAQIWDPGKGAPPSLYVNLWDGSVYMGRLLVIRHHRDFRAADHQLAEILTQRAMRLLRQQRLDDPRQAHGMDNIVFDLLRGNWQDSSDLAQLLNTLRWERGDTYLCVQVKGQQAMSAVFEHALHSDLFRTFPGSYILLSSGQQILVVNLTKTQTKASEISHLLAPLCRDYCLYAGISAPVMGIQELTFAYQQAGIGLNHAFARRGEKWIIPFEACAMEYILDSVASPLPMQQLAAPCLRMLMEYDKEKGTQFFETFRTYLLLERDIPKTAEALIIHRTTLIYRLKKIQSLIHLDLNKSDVRLYLLLSLRMLEKEGRTS